MNSLLLKNGLEGGRSGTVYVCAAQDFVHGMDSITCQGKVIPASAFKFTSLTSAAIGNTKSPKDSLIMALNYCPISGGKILNLHIKIKSINELPGGSGNHSKVSIDDNTQVLKSLEGATMRLVVAKEESMPAHGKAVLAVAIGNGFEL